MLQANMVAGKPINFIEYGKIEVHLLLVRLFEVGGWNLFCSGCPKKMRALRTHIYIPLFTYG
jgi:hypothetical protein